MPSPFPGMDPYLEAQGRWPDLHASMITYCRDALSEILPEPYVAQIGEEVHLVTWQLGERRTIRPDVAVAREERSPAPKPAEAGGAPVATLEPVTVPLAEYEEEVRDTWIEILRLPQLRLVTVIELLSPTKKASSGREEYLRKRRQLVHQPVHLVEIDLLLGGARLPMGRPLPPGDYYAILARAERRPNCDVYAWTVRQPLPTFPIPLLAPDPDVPLDLASVFALAYDRGRYARLIDYSAPLVLPLRREEQSWAEALARGNRAGG